MERSRRRHLQPHLVPSPSLPPPPPRAGHIDPPGQGSDRKHQPPPPPPRARGSDRRSGPGRRARGARGASSPQPPPLGGASPLRRSHVAAAAAPRRGAPAARGAAGEARPCGAPGQRRGPPPRSRHRLPEAASQELRGAAWGQAPLWGRGLGSGSRLAKMVAGASSGRFRGHSCRFSVGHAPRRPEKATAGEPSAASTLLSPVAWPRSPL